MDADATLGMDMPALYHLWRFEYHTDAARWRPHHMTNAELVESLEALAKVCRENPGMGQPSSAETSWHVFTFWCSVIVTPLCVVGWVLYLTRAARCW